MKLNNNNAVAALCIAAISALLPVALALLGGVSFTINGYDVDGGTDPICWELIWWPLAQNLDLQYFNMMPACYHGTNLSVTPLDLDMDENVQVMITNKTYTFNVHANVNFERVAESFEKDLTTFNGSVAIGNRTSRYVFFRMVLCDTSMIGFCNPLAASILNPSEGDMQELDELTAEGWLSNVNEGDVLQGERIGNHIFSPWLNLSLQEVGPLKFAANWTIQMRLPTGQRGAFFVIGHAHLQAHFVAENRTAQFVQAINWLQDQLDLFRPVGFSESGEESEAANASAFEHAIQWLEIGDAIPNNIVDVRPEPKIMVVSDAMIIGVIVTTGVFASFSLFLFGFILKHREHIVMKLAQWQFLLWMVGCCLVSNAFVFTYMPTRDWHCRYGDMLEFIPLTMIGCIMVGRSWRVYLTISAAVNIGIRRNSESKVKASRYYVRKYCVGMLTWVAQFPYNLRCGGAKEEAPRRSTGFRSKVTAAETTRLILWVSLPQILLQVAGVIVYDRGVETSFDQMMTEGSNLCSEGGSWIRRLGIVLCATAYATSVLLAWVSRDLPSAFNETDGIFQSATINTIVGMMAISLDQIATMSRTSPNIVSFLWIATSLIVTSTSLGFIVMPKVMRVLSGEEIIISNLLNQGRISAHPSMEHGLSQARVPLGSSSRATASIQLKKDEPIPKGLETNLLGVTNLIGSVTNELVQGRTPNLKEWERLMGKVEELHNTFERIDFQWTEEDEREAES